MSNTVSQTKGFLDRALGSGSLRWYRLTALLIAFVVVGQVGFQLLAEWREMSGWEAYWIAQSLAAGEGFSFPSEVRWLFDSVNDGQFHATAWMDPIYTFCLAALIAVFGEYHQLAAAVFNLLLLLVVFGLTYRLGERLISPPAGLIAVLTLALIELFPATALDMNNTLLASVMVLLVALTLVRFMEARTNRRAGMLGLVLGLTALACPSTLYFIPVTAVMVATMAWKERRPVVTQAALVLGLALIAMLPWSVRNYLTFKRLIPVRNGTGQIAFMSVVASAGTVAPEKLRSQVKPPFRTASPYFAVTTLRGYEERLALYGFQRDYAKELGPSEYAAMNEAQRDDWFLKETKAFMLAHPRLSLQMAIVKLKLFLRISDSALGILLGLLAAAGGLLAARTPSALILALWAGVFVGPFLIITPFFYRYRAPIEPILAVLAVFAVCKVIEFGAEKLASKGQLAGARG